MGSAVMTRGILALGLVALGCSAGSDGGDDPERPSSCEPADVAGTYFFSAETVDGSCGPQASGLVSLGSTDGSGSTNGCTVLQDTVISEGGCKRANHTICPFDDVEVGGTIESTTVLRDVSGSGDFLEGTMTMIIRRPSGTLECMGTYDVTAERR
jgi:hypothetical protein